MAQQAEIVPKEWTTNEAYRSGRGGFRIKVLQSGNPFRGPLADAWLKGWNDAASEEPPIRRFIYAEEEDDDRKHRNHRFKGNRNRRDTRKRSY